MKIEYSEKFKEAYRKEVKQLIDKYGVFKTHKMVFHGDGKIWTIEHYTELTNTIDRETYNSLDEAIYDIVELLTRDNWAL